MSNKIDKKRIGGLWVKETSKKEKFLSGEVEINGNKIGLFIFKNGFLSENPKGPNFVVYEVAPTKKEDVEAAEQKTDDFV
jgi:hypothetical protein